MLALQQFDQVWLRCADIARVRAFLQQYATNAQPLDELIRAEWVARVSALDLYIHELVAQRMVAIFEGSIPRCDGFSKFKVTSDTLERVRTASSAQDAAAAFDLSVRTQHEILSFQDPEKIADAIRLCSDKELWNEIALVFGATPQNKVAQAKTLKRRLSAIVSRRNKIAHEGDLAPGGLRAPWPIAASDVSDVAVFIKKLVYAIDGIV